MNENWQQGQPPAQPVYPVQSHYAPWGLQSGPYYQWSNPPTQPFPTGKVVVGMGILSVLLWRTPLYKPFIFLAIWLPFAFLAIMFVAFFIPALGHSHNLLLWAGIPALFATIPALFAVVMLPNLHDRRN